MCIRVFFAHRLDRLARARPDTHLASLSKEWYDSVTFSGHGLRFDDVTISESGAVDVAVSWMEKTCLSELTSDFKLSA